MIGQFRLEHYLRNNLSKLSIPKGQIILLHVGLKELHLKYGLNYDYLSRTLLEQITQVLQPLTVLVPTYSLSYVQTRYFNVANTPSDIGRFAEEIRLLKGYGNKRTINPIYSIIDSSQAIDMTLIDNDTAFGRGSLWDYLNERGHYCLNLGIKSSFVTTFFHHIEELHGVPYRELIYLDGHVDDNAGTIKDVSYRFFARNRDRLQWDRARLRNELLANSIMKYEPFPHLPVNYYYSEQAFNYIDRKLACDKFFLVSER